jgi:acetylornithine deacetylase
MKFIFLACLLPSVLPVNGQVDNHEFGIQQAPLQAPPEIDINNQYRDNERKDRLLKLHKELVEIESITYNEYHIGQYLVNYLSARNFTVETQQVLAPVPVHDGGFRENSQSHPRFNVFAYKGQKRNTRILITSHMDTVAPYIPYSRPSKNDICGRGTTDAKGCIASQIMAVEELFASEREQASEGDIGLLFVVGEEVNGAGMKHASELFLRDNITWEAVVFGEPSEHKLVLGHKGALVYEISAHGKSAHSSYPELGINANTMLIRALTAIDDMELPGSEKLGDTTTNIGVIQGGVAMNVIPDEASAMILTRLAAGTPQQAMAKIEEIIQTLDEPRLTVTFGHRFSPVDCDIDIDGKDRTSAREWTKALSNVSTGFETAIKRGGTDIPNLQGNHKRYMYGPGSVLSAHSDHECLTIGDLVRGVDDYKTILRNILAR